jgi:hypothetical protein
MLYTSGRIEICIFVNNTNLLNLLVFGKGRQKQIDVFAVGFEKGDMNSEALDTIFATVGRIVTTLS